MVPRESNGETTVGTRMVPVNEWRDGPTFAEWGHGGKGGLVCQHGNDVPGECASCRAIVAGVRIAERTVRVYELTDAAGESVEVRSLPVARMLAVQIERGVTTIAQIRAKLGR